MYRPPPHVRIRDFVKDVFGCHLQGLRIIHPILWNLDLLRCYCCVFLQERGCNIVVLTKPGTERIFNHEERAQRKAETIAMSQSTLSFDKRLSPYIPERYHEKLRDLLVVEKNLVVHAVDKNTYKITFHDSYWMVRSTVMVSF
jgi:hypothetical protein